MLAQTTPETLRVTAEQYLPEDQDAFYRDSETGLRIKQALYVAYGHRETLSALGAALPTAETTTAAAAGADPSDDPSPDPSAETSIAAAASRASAASMPRRTASAAQTLPILPHLDSDDFTDRFTTTVAAISTQIATTHQAILADQPAPPPVGRGFDPTPLPPNPTTHQAILADQSAPSPVGRGFDPTPLPPDSTNNTSTHPTPQHSPVSPGIGCPSDFIAGPRGLLSPHGP
jgi:hypothetical protein